MDGFWVDICWVTGIGFCRECGLCMIFVFHSDSIVTGVGRGWKGLWRLGQYISNMFHVCFKFLVF